jgi:hypothetical protein
MLNNWISDARMKLPPKAATLDTAILLVDVVLAFVAAPASLEAKHMSAMRWTFPPVHFTAPQ